jgi:hypothetical protein
MSLKTEKKTPTIKRPTTYKDEHKYLLDYSFAINREKTYNSGTDFVIIDM